MPHRIIVAAAAIVLMATPQAQQGAPAVTTVPTSSKVWVGRHAEFEEFLSTAPIEKLQPIGEGVTRPQRAFFAPGGLAASAIVKTIQPGRYEGYYDSYKSEIAAYELDKLLELDMVPPTIERRVNNDKVSVQLWVENSQLLRKIGGQASPDIAAWNRQVYRQRVFDNLIGNVDRNAGNLLVDPVWNLIFIDHSRAFDGNTPRLPFAMTRIDRPFLDHLKALDRKTLQEHIGRWVDFGVTPTLRRRDIIVQEFEKLTRERGEASVIIP